MGALSIYVPIIKIDEDRQVVKGPVLRPGIRDRQGTIIDEDVILDAAHEFLANVNLTTGPGFMHEDMNPDFQIVESSVSEQEIVYEIDRDGVTKSFSYPAGTWFLAMKILNADVWKGISAKVYRGFSIGGRAKIEYQDEEE